MIKLIIVVVSLFISQVLMIKLRNDQLQPSSDRESKNIILIKYIQLKSIGNTSISNSSIISSNANHTNEVQSNKTDHINNDTNKKKHRKKDKKSKKKTSTSALTLINNTLTLKHCTTYSVDGYFTNYGCYECESGYQLSSDIFGIGRCKGKATITNCKTEIQLSNDTMTAKCIQCNEGYGVNNTGKECKELNQSQPLTPNCQGYSIDDNGQIICGRCKTGFSLSMNGTSCASACNITNCDNCVEFDTVQYCNACSPGFIGVLSYPYNMINRCISTNDWLNKIFANSILEELL